MVELQETMRPHVRAVLRTVARASAPRPTAAKRAAKDLRRGLLPAVVAEIRWAFTPPRTWLMGVLANLIFAVGWLAVQPLTLGRHQDWVVLVGTYFSSWILADVTTTNLLGADHYRVLQAVSDGVPFWRVLLIKNLALLVIVGLPTLATSVVLTLWLEDPGAPGRHDPHGRGAHRVLARGGQRVFGVASGQRRAADPAVASAW